MSLSTMQDILIEGFPLFDSIIAVAQAGIVLTDKQQLEVRRYTCAAMYGFANNARAKALETLSVADVYASSFNLNFVLSSNFKTVCTYFKQVLNMDDIIKLYLIARNQILGSGNCPYVFVSVGEAKRLGQGEISKNVCTFFERWGYHITSTDCRKILETAYEEAMGAGVIDETGINIRIYTYIYVCHVMHIYIHINIHTTYILIHILHIYTNAYIICRNCLLF